MSEVLWRHQVLIKPSIFSQAESLFCFRQTIFTQQQQQQLVVQQLSSHARRTRDKPVCCAWMLQKFCCGDSSQFRSVPLIHFSLSLQTPPHTPLGSPPPALLPSHGQWSWDGLELETRLIRHKSKTGDNLLSHFSKGCSPPCLTQSTSWQPVRGWQVVH